MGVTVQAVVKRKKSLYRFLSFIHALIVCGMFATWASRWSSVQFLGFSGVYFNYLAFTFPLFFLLHILLLLNWLLISRKKFLIFLLIGLPSFLLLKPWVSFSFNSETSHQSQQDLKIISFNVLKIERGNDAQLMKFLSQEKPDILLLQEANSFPFTGLHSYNTWNYVGKQLVKIYTHFPIVRSGRIFTDKNGEAYFADINVEGKTVRVISAYLYPFSLDSQAADDLPEPTKSSIKQKIIILKKMAPIFNIHQNLIQKIRECIRESPDPTRVILGGDLNSLPNSYEYFALADVLKDGFVEGPGKSNQKGILIGETFHSFSFPLKIDYIFHSKKIKLLEYKIHNNILYSDHYPTTASFSIFK